MVDRLRAPFLAADRERADAHGDVAVGATPSVTNFYK
jgi:hypothetical protein